MKGTVSFHAVRIELFDEIVQPLLSGRKVNPEPFLEQSLRHRAASFRARRYLWALEEATVEPEPPAAEPGSGLLGTLRSQLRRLDRKEDELTRRVRAVLDPDLHLHGRPFLILEGSAARVAERVDEYLAARDADAADALALEQIAQADPEIAKRIAPAEIGEPSADLAYRSDLLSGLKDLYDIANAARAGESWGRAGDRRRPAKELLADELPFLAMRVHARAWPFWIARDVDGLETVCRASGVAPPDFLVPPRRLFAEACDGLPELCDGLHVELSGPRDVAAFVGPGEVADLIEFLTVHGSRIIQAATRHGEGPACTTLLRKIRECATYAARNGAGYVEASGILPPDVENEAG